MDLLDLYGKPLDYSFTEEEIKFILENSDINGAVAKYFIWKQKRHNGKYVGFMLDFNPNRHRRTGIDNSTDIICQRELCEVERLENAKNYGCRNRVLTVWNYEFVEQLIFDDAKYDIETPDEFIEKCKRLGFSNPNIKIKKFKTTE